CVYLRLVLLWTLVFECVLIAAAAEAPQDSYRPVPGQPGKDVVWIPTPEDTVETMLDMARVTPSDYVIDLGSGDGRNLIAAAKRGARALGVEYNPDLVALSKRAAATAGVSDKATFVQGDMFEADISQATVLALFLLPGHLSKLAPKFLKMKPGTRIVSNTYEIGGRWGGGAGGRAVLRHSAGGGRGVKRAAEGVTGGRRRGGGVVGGAWRLRGGEWLVLEKSFQKVSGALDIGGIVLPVENGRLRGDEISFTVNRVDYAGRVRGDVMEGVAKGRETKRWSATL